MADMISQRTTFSAGLEECFELAQNVDDVFKLARGTNIMPLKE